MSVAPKSVRAEQPRPPLDAYRGQYVALLDGRVVAHAADPERFVGLVRRLGADAERVELTRVPAESEATAVGVG